MSLVSQIAALASRIAEEFKAVREEMAASSGASGWGNVDGGQANSNYGGITPIDGGSAGSF